MSTLTVAISGEEDVVSALKEMGVDIEHQTQRNVATTAINVGGRAKELAPVLKVPRRIKGALYSGGRLRKSIRTNLNADGPLVATVVAGVPYAEPVEKGHRTRSGSRVPAQPFMQPAADEEQPKFIARQEEIVRRAVEDAG